MKLQDDLIMIFIYAAGVAIGHYVTDSGIDVLISALAFGTSSLGLEVIFSRRIK